jgi:hypothetical protein
MMRHRTPTRIGRSPERLRRFRSQSGRSPMPRSGLAMDSGTVQTRSHETGGAVRKLHELEHTADVGESDKTPLILLGEVWVVSATAVLALIAITLLAYRLAS